MPAGWGNSEHSFYTDRSENVRIEGGHLVIQALHKPFAPAGQQFTSARIRTAGRYASELPPAADPSANNSRLRCVCLCCVHAAAPAAAAAQAAACAVGHTARAHSWPVVTPLTPYRPRARCSLA